MGFSILCCCCCYCRSVHHLQSPTVWPGDGVDGLTRLTTEKVLITVIKKCHDREGIPPLRWGDNQCLTYGGSLGNGVLDDSTTWQTTTGASAPHCSQSMTHKLQPVHDLAETCESLATEKSKLASWFLNIYDYTPHLNALSSHCIGMAWQPSLEMGFKVFSVPMNKLIQKWSSIFIQLYSFIYFRHQLCTVGQQRSNCTAPHG